MTSWVKDPKTKRLNRLDTNLKNINELEPEIQDKKTGKAQSSSLLMTSFINLGPWNHHVSIY